MENEIINNEEVVLDVDTTATAPVEEVVEAPVEAVEAPVETSSEAVA